MAAIMTKSKVRSVMIFVVCLTLTGCAASDNDRHVRFDKFNRTIEVANWQYKLRVENQNEVKGRDVQGLTDQYLKATLFVSNHKTGKSLLYSISKDIEDYEAKYKYLSFSSNDDFYIKYNDEYIYPIGYVFEPSNGLSKSERLVYKFQIAEDLYSKLMQAGDAVEYWYIDRMVGLGKICFKQQ